MKDRTITLPTIITVRRIDRWTIEYDVVAGVTHIATADDPGTLWRDENAEMVAAFKEKYPDADINL